MVKIDSYCKNACISSLIIPLPKRKAKQLFKSAITTQTGPSGRGPVDSARARAVPGRPAHLLMAQAEGLLAPVPVQLQDAHEVADGRDDGQAEDRLDPRPGLQPRASREALVLRKETGQDGN